MRIAFLLLLASVVAAGTAAAANRPTVGVRSCRVAETRTQVEAVFGHFATRAEAQAVLDGITKVGFKNVVIESDGCGDFEVELDGIASADRMPFALEAKRAGYAISFEQTDAPNAFHPNAFNASFGTRRTITAANKLERKVASLGFRYVDIAYMGPHAWRVTAPRISLAATRAFRAEAARAKLTVSFVLR
jgi:hypothetical protein